MSQKSFLTDLGTQMQNLALLFRVSAKPPYGCVLVRMTQQIFGGVQHSH